MINKKILWIFLHLSKTGGTTFSGHIQKNMVFDKEYIHLGPSGNHYRKEKGLLPFDQRPVEERSLARVLAGHDAKFGLHELVPGREARYVTFLRDPATRLVSGYNFMMSRRAESRRVSFEEWLKTRGRNPMTKFFMRKFGAGKLKGPERDARPFLDKCWYVGVTETLSQDLPVLFGLIGVPPGEWVNYRVTDTADKARPTDLPHVDNLAPTKLITVTDEIREKIYKKHRKDVLLYQHAIVLNKKFRQDHKLDKA